MAWRNVWRNKRRTVVTIAAMTIALIVTICYQGIVQGYLQNMERNLLDYAVGDVQIFAPDYRENPSIYKRINNSEEIIEKLESAGFKACARLLAAGLGAAGDTSSGVMFIGVDIERDAKVSLIYTQLISGKWLDDNDRNGVVLGRRLARTLDVTTGDNMVVLAQASDGSMANEIFNIRGVLKGVSDSADRSGIFMTSGTFRNLLAISEGAHQMIVRRPLNLDLTEAAKKVQSIAPDADVKTWREIMPTISSMLDSTQGMIAVMSFIIYIAIGILILNAMLMAVFERVRELGIMKALGFGPIGVVALIFLETAFQTGLAIVSALVFGAPLFWYLSKYGISMGGDTGIAMMGLAWDPVWYAVISVESTYTPVSMLIFVVGIAVCYPALKAAYINPIKAIQYH